VSLIYCYNLMARTFFDGWDIFAYLVDCFFDGWDIVLLARTLYYELDILL
jgi:hypothetical protein